MFAEADKGLAALITPETQEEKYMIAGIFNN